VLPPSCWERLGRQGIRYPVGLPHCGAVKMTCLPSGQGLLNPIRTCMYIQYTTAEY
jgi:hypothetical protein